MAARPADAVRYPDATTDLSSYITLDLVSYQDRQSRTWAYDIQGRLTGKQHADSGTVTYTYETTTSRLKSVTDALSQVKTYSYSKTAPSPRPTI